MNKSKRRMVLLILAMIAGAIFLYMLEAIKPEPNTNSTPINYENE